jgi:hypothetical protein
MNRQSEILLAIEGEVQFVDECATVAIPLQEYQRLFPDGVYLYQVSCSGSSMLGKFVVQSD